MSDEEDDGEKEHAPSQRRLDQAREKGDLPRSTELQAAISFGGLALGLWLLTPPLAEVAGSAMLRLIEQSDRIAAAPGFRAGEAAGAASALLLPGLGLLLLAPVAAVFAALAAIQGLVFAPERLRPRLSRLSPLQNFKQRFGVEGLVEFARNTLKLCLAMGLLALIFWRNLGKVTLMPEQDAGGWSLSILLMAAEFLAFGFLFTLVLGGADYLWQLYRHQIRNRMTRKEMTDEARESEGDPHARQERRQRGQEIAMNRMLADVARADVVIVNPTHYAVALKWNRKRGSAPRCLAKGTDEIAARIRQKAAVAGVPLHSDPPTARALHAGVEIGQEIRPEHFAAVAVAIRFADRMRRKKKSWS